VSPSMGKGADAAGGARHAGDWFVGSRRAERQNRASTYTTCLSSSRDFVVVLLLLLGMYPCVAT
jgi:hypothetical protein